MRVLKTFLLSLASTLCLAQSPADRLTGPIDSSQLVALKGNVHGMARPGFDQGRVDGGKQLFGVSLVFKPSPAQQSALNKLLAQQQDRSSPNYHKWLTPAQFADRFGMSRNDMKKVVSWLESQGFTVTSIANSRNMVSFSGTAAQVESAFHTELHSYLVDGEMHFANATEPLLPAALAGVALAVKNLHNFQPRPRVRKVLGDEVNPYFTSNITGNHFVAPDDFATIYDVQALYAAGIDGTNQTIAVVGQSLISTTDVDHFRSAANLGPKNLTLTLVPNTGNPAHCNGDEDESDLDVEWSGGVAKNAAIVLVYTGLVTGDTCANRQFGAFDALQYAIDQTAVPKYPVISSSYGLCENTNSSVGITQTDALAMQSLAKQANTQGQTIVASSGDDGAADCDFHVKSATHGLAVDIPAAIPEVTGVGGTEFNEGTGTYWNPTNNGNAGSAISYIPEKAWNDTVPGGVISASGGGASIYFQKPSWQTSTGVPNDLKRHVPDIALNASPDHDGYLFCSPIDGAKNPSCTAGFRDSGGFLDIVGGTSAGAPTFAAIVALLNQYLVTKGFMTTPGLANVNPNLYRFAQFNPSALNDVKSGNNMVPCTSGSTNCPSSGLLGFSAGTGYDQVTGLGSVNAHAVAVAWADLFNPTSTTLSSSATPIIEGNSETFTAAVTPPNATGAVSFYNNGSTTALGTATVSGGIATFTTTSLPAGTDSVTATYTGIFANSTSSPVTITVIPPQFTLKSSVPTISVVDGASGSATLTITPGNAFPQTISFSCSGLPSESQCMFSPLSVTPNGAKVTDTLTITTVAPTGRLQLPFGGSGFVYALLLPGLFGLCFTASRKHAASGTRLLSLIMVLGFATLWLGACGGNSSSGNPGTPKGTSAVVVTASTGGTGAVTQTVQITLTVN